MWTPATITHPVLASQAASAPSSLQVDSGRPSVSPSHPINLVLSQHNFAWLSVTPKAASMSVAVFRAPCQTLRTLLLPPAAQPTCTLHTASLRYRDSSACWDALRTSLASGHAFVSAGICPDRTDLQASMSRERALLLVISGNHRPPPCLPAFSAILDPPHCPHTAPDCLDAFTEYNLCRTVGTGADAQTTVSVPISIGGTLRLWPRHGLTTYVLGIDIVLIHKSHVPASGLTGGLLPSKYQKTRTCEGTPEIIATS